jgi:hypothetical protein
MKKRIFTITTFLAYTTSNLFCQTISTFEENVLEPNSYWDGSIDPEETNFTSGNAIFSNSFDTTFFYWASGWAYSNMQDSTTAGFLNLFGAMPAIGNNNSSNYAIGQQNSIIRLTDEAAGNTVNGIYITNGTFAALSMAFGDEYAKKFGGETGNDPDYFKLSIRSFYNGILSTNLVEFYLADFTFEDNTNDYIVKDWEWVDLTSLGDTDSLLFNLSSSDEGEFGINTPLFFCIDDLTTSDGLVDLNEKNSFENTISFYPNPVSNYLYFQSSIEFINSATINISDLSGKIISNISINKNENFADISTLESGIYFISLKNENKTITSKIIKQ